jgi:hypothetical protein
MAVGAVVEHSASPAAGRHHLSRAPVDVPKAAIASARATSLGNGGSASIVRPVSDPAMVFLVVTTGM